ncbi:hypothetical protein V1478_010836 [Vespula squamosa]|uniref:Uncharacterized protein n=1 Tax=Vespula squamosa TaxID=30214 RepID=A0ABD2AFG5_VESSQ
MYRETLDKDINVRKISVRQLARARENPNVGRLRESDREPRSTAFHNLPNGTISIRITRHSNESRPIISGVSQTPVSDLLPSNMIYIELHCRLIP